MGNFFTNDAGGALLGALAGKLVNDAQARQHNARWKDTYELTQQQMGVNDADRAAAEKKVLANTGMDQYLGIDPRDGILQNKKLYADAQSGYNRALAAGDTEQQKYYQGLMDNEHSKADFWRKIAQFKDLDLTGYGSNNTLDEATKRQLNKLVEAQNPPLPSTVGTTLTDLGGGLQGPLGAAVQKEHDYRASVEDFRKMYGDEIKEAAEEEARARVMNPQWGKELEYKLREKFISPQIISDMLKYAQEQRQQMYSSEVIQSAIDKLKAGEFSDYYSTGLRALQENPTLAKTILSGAPAPRDMYGTQTGRENMALQHGYRLDTMGKQYEYGQQGADAALARQKDLMSYTADVKRYFANATAEDRVKFFRALGVPDNVIQAAVTGVGKSSGRQTVSPQYKAASDYVKSWQAAHKNDEGTEWQNDATYQSALEVMKAGFAPQQNATLTELGTGMNNVIKSLSGSAGGSDKAIESVRQALENYKGQLTDEQIGNINQYLDGANAIRELRAGYTDQARKYAGGVDIAILQRLGITKEELNALAAKPRDRLPRQEGTTQAPRTDWSSMSPDEDWRGGAASARKGLGGIGRNHLEYLDR